LGDLIGGIVEAEFRRTKGRRPQSRRGGDADQHEGLSGQLLAIQARAGNAATAQLLQRGSSTSRGPLPVQRNAKFDQAATKPYDEADAPEDMKIPAELNDGLQAAWAASFPGGTSQEQGGILVLTKEGKYVWRAGKGTGSGSFSVNYGDVKAGEVLIASAHTHPYDESEGGSEDVAFSGGDLSNLVWQTERVKVVQSGTSQFGVTKTKEFDALVAAADTPEKQEALEAEMDALWNDTFKNAGKKVTFQEKVVRAAKAVCSKYHLVYMEGRAGDLAQPTKPVVKAKAHVEAVVPELPKAPEVKKVAEETAVEDPTAVAPVEDGTVRGWFKRKLRWLRGK